MQQENTLIQETLCAENALEVTVVRLHPHQHLELMENTQPMAVALVQPALLAHFVQLMQYNQ